MSAWVCNMDYIGYMVHMAQRIKRTKHVDPLFRFRHKGKFVSLNLDNDKEVLKIMRELHQQNIHSVKYLYDRPTSKLPAYSAEKSKPDLKWVHMWEAEPTNVFQIVKACTCYMYQSCEGPRWETSLAKTFVTALVFCAIASDPAYELTVWGIPTRAAKENARPIIGQRI